MWRPQVLLRFVIACCLFHGLTVHAQSTKTARKKDDAQAWLGKIQTAAQRLDYAGTFVYQQANQVRTSRITHIASGQNEIEKLEVLDGKPREYIRNNEKIVSYVPETKTLLIENRVIKDIFPSILTTKPSGLTDYYHLKEAEDTRVAGYEARAIILQPKDSYRYGYKLWAEKSTGLLLRAQTLNEKNAVIEQIAFTQLSIGNIDQSEAKPSISNTRGWRVENALMSNVSASRWTVKAPPPGFRRVREIKRLLTDNSSPKSENGKASLSAKREVTQIVFSDGLAAISVFVEAATSNRTEGVMHQGAMNILSKRQGNFWLTIVGEVPSGAIKKIADSLELKSDK